MENPEWCALKNSEVLAVCKILLESRSLRRDEMFPILDKLRFRYKGPSIEAVLDRLPTAQVISQDEAGYVVEAEAYGKGMDMWLRSQGDMVEMPE